MTESREPEEPVDCELDEKRAAFAGVRRAVREDNQKLLALMSHVPMEGSLVVATQRDPDFFALFDMQRGDARTFLYDDGSFAGMCAAHVRDGWLDGSARKVGYLGDLRIRGKGRARRAFPSMFGHFFGELCKETGCHAYLTAVLASNTIALASLTRRRKKRAEQPYYHLLHPYEMASIQTVWKRREKIPSGLVVDSATPDDTKALAAFLHEDHRRRPFGYRFDDGELEHRLARWPGFSLEDTLIVRDDSRRIVGACTLWDAAPVKRYRVLRYAGVMKATRLALGVASTILRGPPLPREGEDFKYLYLTNLSVKDDHPVVLRALLERAATIAWRRRVHFVSFPLYEGLAGPIVEGPDGRPRGAPDPLSPSLKGFVVQRLRFHLYAVTEGHIARTDWPGGRPGFEMALA